MSRAHRYCRCGAVLARDHPEALCATCQGQLRWDSAPTVPPEFWEARWMFHAMASGDLGQILRAYRRHSYHGRILPQQLVAGWLHISQSSLSRLESGARRPSVDDWAQCAQLLGLPVSVPWARTEPGASSEVDPINRRSLLGNATTGLAAAMSVTAQPASAAAVDPELVPHWLELKGVLTGHDQMFGPHEVLGIAKRGLDIIGRHRVAARGHLQRAGLAVACAAAGEPDRAAREGLHALRIAQATRSERAMHELRRLDRRLAAAPTAHGATEFREALAAVA